MPTEAPRRRIPLTVVGGFLGAGKTTLLNHWLRHAGGRRLAVLVNDFGALNIDAALIAARGADSIALSNGCVCCQIGDDLSAALIGLLQAEPPCDAIVVEASGVSDPWRIAQIALADPALSLGGVIVLVDSAALPAHARDPLLADTLQRQLDSADLLVLNKTDLVDAVQRRDLDRWLDAHAGAVPRLAVSQGELPLALLDELAPRPSAQPLEGCRGSLAAARAGPGAHAHAHADAHGHADADADADAAHRHPPAPGPRHAAAPHPQHGALFDTWVARPASELGVATLRSALRELPAGVLRMKGLLRTREHGWSELQFAGRHGSLRPALAAPADGAALVAIGLRGRLQPAALDAWLQAAGAASDGADVQPGASAGASGGPSTRQ